MNDYLEKNIVLIGMPGCGKTTIGNLLAQKLDINFYDVDKYIEFKEKMSINDIFKKGETYFRRLESETISDIVKKSTPMIISTGGGVIKSENNMKLLTTFWKASSLPSSIGGSCSYLNIPLVGVKSTSIVVNNSIEDDALKKNSIVIFINRPIENIVSDIDMKTRPLLRDGVSKIYELYNERYDLYKRYCDYEVLNDESLENVVDKIIRLLKG